MKNKLILVLLLLLSCFANAQMRDGRLIEDANGRFIGDIKVLRIMNRATYEAADKTGFLYEFTLKMKVWDYLGEPMEMYAFQWSRNKSYTVKVDNEKRRITLEELEEYPDLTKRFNDLRPTKVDIGISGIAGDESEENTSNYYKVGQVNVPDENIPIVMHFKYTVKDVDLLIARAGEFREPTIAGSPPTWNEFFNWSYSPPGGGDYVQFNISEASFKKLSEEEKKQRIKKIKNIWKQVKQFSVSASLKTLEWPELEMIDIIKTYDRYKNKKKELSPQEKIDAELAKVQRTTEYTKNDDWGELPVLKEELPEIGIDLNLKVSNDYYTYKPVFVFKNTRQKINIIDDIFLNLKTLSERDDNSKSLYSVPKYGVKLTFVSLAVIKDRLLLLRMAKYNANYLIIYDLEKLEIINNDIPYQYFLKSIKKISPEGFEMPLKISDSYKKSWEKTDAFNVYTSESRFEYKRMIQEYIEKGKTYYILDRNPYGNNHTYYILNEDLERVGKFNSEQ